MREERDTRAMTWQEHGTGEPLVLVPGGLTGWRSWVPHAEALAPSRRVIRVQLRNVELGLEGAPLPPGYTLDHEVRALARTLDEIGIEQADFAGWSLGGSVVLSYALHHPRRVRSLTLIEPAAYWALPDAIRNSPTVREEREFYETMATDDVSEEQLVEFAHRAGLADEDVDPRSLPLWPVWLEHRQSLRFGGAESHHQDSLDLVRRFEKPVLLLKGEGSTPTMHDVIDALAAEFPNAQVVLLPGAHAAHIASFQPFLELFTQFMAAASRPQ